MLPNSLRSVSFRRLRCPRGGILAVLICEGLQTFLQPLAPPFTAFGDDFTLDFSQTRERFLRCIHMSTVLPWIWFMPVEEPFTLPI